MTRTTQPTLRWLSVLLRTVTCTPHKAVAAVQLYSVTRQPGRHGARQSRSTVAIVGRCRLTDSNAPSAARWIVSSARREARRRHDLLVGFLILR